MDLSFIILLSTRPTVLLKLFSMRIVLMANGALSMIMIHIRFKGRTSHCSQFKTIRQMLLLEIILISTVRKTFLESFPATIQPLTILSTSITRQTRQTLQLVTRTLNARVSSSRSTIPNKVGRKSTRNLLSPVLARLSFQSLESPSAKVETKSLSWETPAKLLRVLE